jgi:hypothetical protein
MISERGADDTAANDHDVSSMRQRFRHEGPFRARRSATLSLPAAIEKVAAGAVVLPGRLA